MKDVSDWPGAPGGRFRGRAKDFPEGEWVGDCRDLSGGGGVERSVHLDVSYQFDPLIPQGPCKPFLPIRHFLNCFCCQTERLLFLTPG